MNESAGQGTTANGVGRGATVPTILEFHDKPPQNTWLTSTKLAFASPWRRFRKGSFLSLKLEGDIPEKSPPRLLPSASPCMPALCECIRKAAYDPRVGGLYIHIEPLAIGFARLQEIMAHIEFFRRSGKPTVAYVERGAEREYMLASACEEVYVPPMGLLLLFGYCVQGMHVRGTLDKLGIEPTVKRLGKYKTGDIILRKDMSDEEREVYTSLLDGIHSHFVTTVAKARGKTEEEVKALLDEGVYDMQQLVEGGWVTAVKYPDELQEDLDRRFGNEKRKKTKHEKAAAAAAASSAKPPKKLAYVEYKKYKTVSLSAFGLTGRKVVAVVRECGSIVGGSQEEDGYIRAAPLIQKLRKLAEDDSVAGIVLRVDSGGGDALASDLMWREIRKLAKEKPLVATMGDVAGSGGYYISMGAPTVLAQPLTITGSIGVFLARFNLTEWYKKIGFSKTLLSRGKYAEIYTETRNANAAEDALMDNGIKFIYTSFRDKAAESRGMAAGEMEEHAQGRIWLGKDACEKRLVDYQGGVANAVALVKQAANIPPTQQVTIREVSAKKLTLRMLLTARGGGGADVKGLLWMLLTNPVSVLGTLGFSALPMLLQPGSILPHEAACTAATAATASEEDSNGAPQLAVDPQLLQAAGGITAGSEYALRAAMLPTASMPAVHIGSSSASKPACSSAQSALDSLDELK